MRAKQVDSILDKIIIIGFSIYVLGAVVSVAIMNTGLGLALLAWLIKKGKKFDFKLPATPYNKYILFFLLALGLSVVDSLQVENSLDVWKRFIVPILLFYILIDLMPSLKVITGWFVGLFITMSGSLVYSFWQYQQGVNRVHGNIFVMEFASLLVFMAIYTAVYSLWGQISLKNRLLLGLTSILTVVALVFTQTRGAWVAFIISLGSVLILKNKKYLVYFLIVIILLMITAPYFVPQEYVNRFKSIFDLKNNRSNLTRLNLWKGAVLIYRDHWWTGIGLNNFSAVIHQDPYLHKPIVSDAHAHNVFLQLAAETGTLGLLSFGLLFGTILKCLYSYYQLVDDQNLKLFFLGSFGMIVAYLSHGLTEYNLLDMHVTRLVWFILAISVVIKKKYNVAGRD